MKAIGIIRRIDELGRIVIPKEIRSALGVGNGTAMEIFATDDSVVFKRYDAANHAQTTAQALRDQINLANYEPDVQRQLGDALNCIDAVLRENEA